MRKALLVVLLLALVAAGGVTWKVLATRGGESPGPVGSGTPGSVVMPADYAPTEEEQAWINSRSMSSGVFVKKFGDWRVVLVAMGERPTGGYSVEIVAVGTADANWVVDARFVSPGPNDIVTQVLTFPYQCLKIKDDALGIRARDVTEAEPKELAVITD